jgi:uncharacterized RDD family membrane protein YckC
MGVRKTWPAMVRRAFSISASVTGNGHPLVGLPAQLYPVLGRCDDSAGQATCAGSRLPSFSQNRNQGRPMVEGEPRRIGFTIEVKPHAYDPVRNPELFQGVLARRILAFCIDFIIISVPVMLASLFILLLAIVTFGFGLVLFLLLMPAALLWALFYYAVTFGSAASATIGMRIMDLEMRTWYGAPSYFLLGAMHAVLFWASISFLTPLVLLVGLFNGRRRLLHDIVLGTVVINSFGRTQPAQPARTY